MEGPADFRCLTNHGTTHGTGVLTRDYFHGESLFSFAFGAVVLNSVAV